MDAQAWDRIAGAYFDEISTPFQAEVVNPLLDYLDGLPGREELTIADLGCGIGNLLPFLAERFKTVVAVDFFNAHAARRSRKLYSRERAVLSAESHGSFGFSGTVRSRGHREFGAGTEPECSGPNPARDRSNS